MIIYDLECESGHPFEGWFSDRGHMEAERDNGRLSCPACGSGSVRIVPSGGHVKTSVPLEPPAHRGGSFLQALGQFLDKNFENVGTDFAERALKMHLGEEDLKNIRGQASEEEERELREEGVEFFKVPLPKFQS